MALSGDSNGIATAIWDDESATLLGTWRSLMIAVSNDSLTASWLFFLAHVIVFVFLRPKRCLSVGVALLGDTNDLVTAIRGGVSSAVLWTCFPMIAVDVVRCGHREGLLLPPPLLSLEVATPQNKSIS